jgi:hypothetical protein
MLCCAVLCCAGRARGQEGKRARGQDEGKRARGQEGKRATLAWVVLPGTRSVIIESDRLTRHLPKQSKKDFFCFFQFLQKKIF